MGVEVSGVLGLIVLIVDIWAIINVLGAPNSPVNKLLWIVVIVLLPVIGALLWLFFGPRTPSP